MNIAVYGLGLIGGSFGRTLVKNTGHTVFGADIDRAAVEKAIMLSAIHEEVTEENIGDIDFVVLAVNPSAAVKIMRDIVPKLKRGAVVIDCGGTKRKVTREMERLFLADESVSFAGCHPMAGKEFSGINHSSPLLFNNAYFILVPVHTPIDALLKIKSVMNDLGCAGIAVSTAEKHDRLISYTSQLAHIVSSAYIQNPLSLKHVGFSAGSFRDMTRVAKLSPDMWTELFLENKDNLLKQLKILQENLDAFKSAIENDDAEKLRFLLDEGSKMKEQAEAARKNGVIND